VAQYVLLDLRKEFSGVQISLGILFQSPTLRGFATEIERLKDPIGLELNAGDANAKQTEYYSSDRKKLAEQLPTHFETTAATISSPKTVFITGGTGFLGSHVIDQLFKDKKRFGKIYVHVRAQNAEEGLERVQNTCTAYGLQCDVEVVLGDLAKPLLGVEKAEWAKLAEEVDVIIHNVS
jgi:L-2-aminoadipate reductase